MGQRRALAAPALLLCSSLAVVGWLAGGGAGGERAVLLGDGAVDEFLSQGLVSGVAPGGTGLTGAPPGRTQSLSLEHLGSWRGLAKGLGVSLKDPLAHKPKFKDSGIFGPSSVSARADAKIDNLVGSDPSISLSLQKPKPVKKSQGLSAVPSLHSTGGLVLPSPGAASASITEVQSASTPSTEDFAAERLQMRKYMLSKIESQSEAQTNAVSSMPDPGSTVSAAVNTLGATAASTPLAANVQLGEQTAHAALVKSQHLKAAASSLSSNVLYSCN